MGNIFNKDFVDFIESLNSNEIEYVLVGGYSVIFHGYPRTTETLISGSIEMKKTIKNWFAHLTQFEMPVF